jgi:hypothetical protein
MVGGMPVTQSGSFLRRNFRASGLCGFLSQLFAELVRIHGMLARLLAEFMSRQMVFFAMGDGRGRMRVSRKVVEFRSSLMKSL